MLNLDFNLNKIYKINIITYKRKDLLIKLRAGLINPYKLRIIEFRTNKIYIIFLSSFLFVTLIGEIKFRIKKVHASKYIKMYLFMKFKIKINFYQ